MTGRQAYGVEASHDVDRRRLVGTLRLELDLDVPGQRGADLGIRQVVLSMVRQFLHQVAQKSISTGFRSRSAAARP